MVEPRIALIPKYASSLGQEAVEFVASAGLKLDEHQAYVLEHALGKRKDGRWAAPEVAVVEPRQNGKNAILEARQLVGLFLLAEQLQIHSAHLADTSLEAFRRLVDLIDGRDDLRRRVKSIRFQNGHEQIELREGPRIRFRTRTKGGGRGFSADTLYLDESMILPEVSFGAMLPSLSARSVTGNPQVWFTGSAVDQFVHEHGVVLARVRERALGKSPELAYFEWSLEGDDPNHVPDDLLADRVAWARANPALGVRIAPEHIELERRSMDPRTFAVERLGVGDWPPTVSAKEVVIDLQRWAAMVDQDSKMVDPITLAFDVAPDRSVSSLAVAGRRVDGIPHIEIAERKRGTRWVVDLIAEITANNRVQSVLCDSIGPAAALVAPLEQMGITVLEISSRDLANACGLFFDLVEQEGLRHLGTADLIASIKGAAKRPLGDRWAWSRRSSLTDITPLVASTLALWGALTEKPAELMIAAV